MIDWRKLGLLPASLVLSCGVLPSASWAFSPTRPRMDLVLATSKRPVGQAPWNGEDANSRAAIRWTHDTLYELTYLDEFPQLRTLLAAERATSNASKTHWSIPIKKGLSFSDGKPVTAADFVRTWEALKKLPRDSAAQRIFLSRIQSFHARDALNLEVELSASDPDFETLLTLPFTAPSQSEPTQDPPGTGTTHPGTGPFVLTDWQAGFGLSLQARRLYSNSFFPTDGSREFRSLGFFESASKPLPQVDHLRVDWVQDERSAWKAFQEGRTDLLDLDSSFSAEVVDPAKPWLLKPTWSGKGIKLEKGWTPRHTLAVLNSRTLPKASDRARILDKMGANFWKSVAGPTHLSALGEGALPLLEDWLELSRSTGNDRPRKKAPKSAKIEKLPVLRIETAGTDSRSLQITEKLQSLLEHAGYPVQIRNSERSTSLTRFKNGEADILVLGWNWEVPTLRNLLEPLFFLEPEGSPELRSLENALVQARQAPASQTRRILEESLEAAALWSPGFRHERQTLVQPWVFGFRVSSAVENPEKYLRVDREIRRNYIGN